MSELLPCPFCGSEAEILTGKSLHGERLYGIMCNCCTARTDLFDTEDSAINSWNSRAERTCHDASVDSSTQFYCSECDCTVDVPLLWGEVNYCPNCGAKVVGE